MSRTILIADDEAEIRELLSLYLEADGLRVLEASDGAEAIRMLEEHEVALLLLDIMMPNMDGLRTLKEIRKTRNIPVILLSAKSHDNDKILGLGLGADDYIAKPFNPLEVTARIQAQLRRYYRLGQAPEQNESAVLTAGDLQLDPSSCTVSKHGSVLPLTSLEYKMVELMMRHPGKVFTKKQMFESIWDDYYFGDDNTIMVHISKIREKLEDDPRNPTYIITVRGIGYKFEKRTDRNET